MAYCAATLVDIIPAGRVIGKLPGEWTPMSHADWRAPGAYEDLRSLDAPGFAWEYLRRNADFQRQRKKLERAARQGLLNQAEADAFTRRWGVRFRERYRDKQRRPGSMGGARPTKRGRPDGASG
jgi:hypothetical protein